MYRQPSELCDEYVLSSECGVQQGDPLGPLLFSLVSLPIAKAVRSPLYVWYLDDGTFGGPLKDVLDDYPRIVAEGREVPAEVLEDVIELSDSPTGDDPIGELVDSFRRLSAGRQGERLPLGRWDMLELDPAALTNAVIKMSSAGLVDEEFVRRFHFPITRKDLRTLNVGVKLNDEIINYYFKLIEQRKDSVAGLPKLKVFNTAFLKLYMDDGYDRVKNWTKKKDLSAYDIVLIPVNMGDEHWTLIKVDFRDRSVLYYDSVYNDGMALVNDFVKDFECARWSFGIASNVPKQRGGVDCGVFVCRFADCLAMDRLLGISQADMPYFREHMAVEILGGALLA